MLVYKLLTADEMTEFNRTQEVPLSAADREDGFVHLSTGTQVTETADRHFADSHSLYMMAVDPDRLGDALKWEAARHGGEFPHYYGQLTARHVVWTRPIARDIDGGFRFPEDLGP